MYGMADNEKYSKENKARKENRKSQPGRLKILGALSREGLGALCSEKAASREQGNQTNDHLGKKNNILGKGDRMSHSPKTWMFLLCLHKSKEALVARAD